jgi:ABC-type branched-subunit amino acid transport system ATPase component
VLSLKGIVAGYGGGDVLQGVDLEIERGSITCIVGPNGAGKSTVLRTISGLLKPSRGSIEFDGKPLVKMSCSAILAAGIVQVPQHHALFPGMTVRENVMMGGYLLRRDRSLLKKRYEMVEDIVPLVRDRSHEKAGNLSGGERRMVEIGRVLMLSPELIMMDEPSLGLEPKAVKKVSELIALANREGRTILLVEQNVRLGFSIANHGVIMEGGKVRLEGEPRSLLENPDMTSLYLGGTVEQPADGADSGTQGTLERMLTQREAGRARNRGDTPPPTR